MQKLTRPILFVLLLSLIGCQRTDNKTARHISCELVSITLANGRTIEAYADPYKARESYWSETVEKKLPRVDDVKMSGGIELAKLHVISKYSEPDNRKWIGRIEINRDDNGVIKSGSCTILSVITRLGKDSFEFKVWDRVEDQRDSRGGMHYFEVQTLSSTVRYTPQIKVEEIHFSGPVTIDYIGSGPGIEVYER